MNNEKLLSKDVNVIHSLNNSIKFYTHTHTPNNHNTARILKY